MKDRKRRKQDPNYVPTPEDKDDEAINDALGAAAIGAFVALVAYGILRWMRKE